MSFKSVCLLGAICGGVAFSSSASAEGVLAGTLIENTAKASYDLNGTTLSVDSNTVTIKVDELLDVSTTSSNAAPQNATGGSAVLTYSIANTGNGPEAYTLTANPAVAGNDFDTTVTNIVIDTNDNGVYDPGVDTILTSPEQTTIIAPDEMVTIFVLVTVPAEAEDLDESEVELRADAVTGTGAAGTVFSGQGENGADAIVGLGLASDTAKGAIIIGASSVEVVKSASVIDPFGGSSAVKGSTITYTIATTVSGSVPANNLVAKDTIPTGTTYVPSSLTLDGDALSDAADADAGEVGVDGVAVNLGTVSDGASHTVTFNVTID